MNAGHGLCQHRPGHSLGMEKVTLGFHIYKIWQILKRFAGIFRQSQTLKLGSVLWRSYFAWF